MTGAVEGVVVLVELALLELEPPSRDAATPALEVSVVEFVELSRIPALELYQLFRTDVMSIMPTALPTGWSNPRVDYRWAALTGC